MKARGTLVLAALAAFLVAGVLAGAGSAGTSGIGGGNLVFSGIDSTDGMSDIYVMKADGTAKTNITHDLGIRKDQSPSFSPDGKKIVFTRQNANSAGSRIMLVNSDGSGLTDVTPGSLTGSKNVDPSWSPDGTSIVYSSNTTGHFEVYSLKVGSPVAVRLTKTVTPVQNLDPAWSPSGKSIVFSRSGDRASTGAAELFQLKLGSSQAAARLTKTIQGRGDVGAVYSPDGSQIAFSSDRAGNNDVYTLDLTSGTVTRLTTSAKSDSQPAYAPDGSAIVYVSTRSGATELWAQSLSTLSPGPSEPIQLTSDGQFKANPGWAPAANDPPPVAAHPVAIGPPVPVPVPVFLPPSTTPPGK